MNTPPARPWRSMKGLQFEQIALDYLRARGLVLLQRNYRCPLGEIDLIMRDKNTLVFVEVRYRASSSHGAAHETVDHRKQRKLRRSAQHYLLCHRQHAHSICRFDVLGISSAEQPLRFDWYRNAFF